MTETITPTHRATSNYTLTLTVPDPTTAVRILQDILGSAQIVRTSTVLDSTRAGVSWRSADDKAAARVAARLHGYVAAAMPITAERLHTGYGIHTRVIG